MKLLFAVSITALLFACSCSDSFSPRGIGEGFYIGVRGANTLLHNAGNAQLFATEGGKIVPIWNYISFGTGEIATTGVCLFTGGLSDERRWSVYPALLAYQSPGPVVEITEAMTRLYCEQERKKYETARGVYCFKYPTMTTNGTISIKGNRLPPSRRPKSSDVEENPEWITVQFTTNELFEIIETVKKTGVLRSYDGIDYRIADPVDLEPGQAQPNQKP